MNSLNLDDFKDIELEEQAEDVVEDNNEVGVKMAFVGGGQCGCRIADTFYDKFGYRRVLLFNTTKKDMEGLKTPEANQVLSEKTDGAGKDYSKGRKAIEQSKNEVLKVMKNRFKEGIDKIMVCIGAGGGTGSGTAKILADISEDYLYKQGMDNAKNNIGFIVTLPDRSEGSIVFNNAYKVLKDIIGKGYSPIMILDNAKVTKMLSGQNLTEANRWFMINNVACKLFDIFNTISAQQSKYTNFDPTDLKDVYNSGIITVGLTKLEKVSKDTDIADALYKNLKNNLLVEGLSINSATHGAVIIATEEETIKNIPASSTDNAFNTLISMMNGGDTSKKVALHRGVYEASGSGITVFSMIGGFEFPQDRLDSYKRG